MVYIKLEIKETDTCGQTTLKSHLSADIDSKDHFRIPLSQSQLSKNAPKTHARQRNHLRYNQPRHYHPQHGHHRRGAWGSSKKPGQRFWTCPKCRETMTINRKCGHVHCKREYSTPKGIQKWPCDVCGIHMANSLREYHLQAVEHAINAAICIPPHPNGKRYIEIKEVRWVYHHIRAIPVRCYRLAGAYKGHWKGGITFVSAEDVENAKALMHGNGGIDTPSSDGCRDECFYKDLYL
ncbi:hypothetical protein BO94DRAFT_45492 [Aspergillus sclerotioniger CBS 115572]|uniref:Uncharacterized protein n=1 Tax=Aspergillus sclerotioniger CBS 115572 TaxID=1450535 RepID=A0A317WUT7_9EURO|nr:hypothetical protein BO94DRAFT_45492 [Aspergillus sclerotioniger CBS 115572]PWY88608.1 hypothetical protein BO94DRAFT_45492 [Aspergillus sclerotioniger CBS 115572]